MSPDVAAPQSIDLLIHGWYVVTMNAASERNCKSATRLGG
jgi:hypothetical protein